MNFYETQRINEASEIIFNVYNNSKEIYGYIFQMHRLDNKYLSN